MCFNTGHLSAWQRSAAAGLCCSCRAHVQACQSAHGEATCSWMEISDCRAVMQLLNTTAVAVKRSPASPYAASDPQSELMITKGTPARAAQTLLKNLQSSRAVRVTQATQHCTTPRAHAVVRQAAPTSWAQERNWQAAPACPFCYQDFDG